MEILGWFFIAAGALAACGFAWMKTRVKILIQSGPAAALKDVAWIFLTVGAVILIAEAFGFWG